MLSAPDAADASSAQNLAMTVVAMLPDSRMATRKDTRTSTVGDKVGLVVGAADGDVLSAYVGAGPPEGSGLHRYVFLLYRQPGTERLAFEGVPRLPNTRAEHRAGFKARDFAKTYGLGDPVAARVFQAAHDDYVPVLMKQLGF